MAIDIDGFELVERSLTFCEPVLERVVFLDEGDTHLMIVSHLFEETLSLLQTYAQLDNAGHFLGQQSVFLLGIDLWNFIEPHCPNLLLQFLDLKLLVKTLLL